MWADIDHTWGNTNQWTVTSQETKSDNEINNFSQKIKTLIRTIIEKILNK